jgi:hypothetical protein
MKSMLPLIRVLVFPVLFSVPAIAVQPAGGTINTTVVALNPAGYSTADALGITYNYGGGSTSEPKIYAPEYWGVFPLFLPGTTMTFRVTVANNTDQGKKPFRLKVHAVSNVLKEAIDGGGIGQQIGAPQTWTIIDLRPGESWTIDGSVYVPSDGSIPSGLDLTRVIVSQLNDAGTDEDPKGFEEVEGCAWCPPPRATVASQNSSALRLAQQWRSEQNGTSRFLAYITAPRQVQGTSHGRYPRRNEDARMQPPNKKFANRTENVVAPCELRQNQMLS